MAVTRASYAEIADDPHRGLFIADAEADLLLEAPAALSLELQAERERLAHEELMLAQDDHSLLAALAQRIGLNVFEQRVLLLTLAPTLDLRYERIFAYLQDDVTRKRPTVDLALRLFTRNVGERYAAHAAFDATAPLRRFHLVRLHDDGLSFPNLIGQSLQLAPRAAAALLGSNTIDGELSTFVTIMPAQRRADELLLPAPMLERVRRCLTAGPTAALLVLEGPYGSGRRRLLAALAAESERPLIVVQADVLRLSEGVPSELCGRIAREALLQGAVTLWFGVEALFDGDGSAQWRGALLATLVQQRTGHLLAVGRPWHHEDLSLAVQLEVMPELTIEQRSIVWQRYLAPQRLPDEDIDALSGAFRLTAGRIRDAVSAARRIAQAAGCALTSADLAAACRALTSSALGTLARKVESTYHWDDIVLPADQLDRLREITVQMRYRRTVLERWGFERHLAMGKGIVILFSGESGTGKTMAAEIIARELGLQLYKIDLSSMVSKYIGETEKNLERIFVAALEANAVLFFDEADAIFGKRSEVKDAHDRYANIEVGYLLQRIESYSGVVILATNLRNNLDSAFLRRLHVAIDFPRPKETERLKIWQRVFPPDAPLDVDVDRAALARQFDLAGGNIRNVALFAAYLAASDNLPIGMNHLIQAVRREYQKSGRLVN